MSSYATLQPKEVALLFKITSNVLINCDVAIEAVEGSKYDKEIAEALVHEGIEEHRAILLVNAFIETLLDADFGCLIEEKFSEEVQEDAKEAELPTKKGKKSPKETKSVSPVFETPRQSREEVYKKVYESLFNVLDLRPAYVPPRTTLDAVLLDFDQEDWEWQYEEFLNEITESLDFFDEEFFSIEETNGRKRRIVAKKFDSIFDLIEACVKLRAKKAPHMLRVGIDLHVEINTWYQEMMQFNEQVATPQK
jgi:hypothetical protein